MTPEDWFLIGRIMWRVWVGMWVFNIVLSLHAIARHIGAMP